MACAPARAIAAIRIVLNILVLILFCLILINLWLDLSFNLGNKVFIRSNNEDFSEHPILIEKPRFPETEVSLSNHD